jgi:hypothetical protein
MLAVLEVSQCFLLEITIDKQTFNVSELRKETFKLFVVVIFDATHFFAHSLELCYLVVNLLLELSHFARKITDLEFVKHNHIVLSVFP